MKVKVTQSCQTLCDLMDYTVHGILQVRILEWVVVLFSRGSSQPRDQFGVSSGSLLQGIFPTQGSNPGLLHCGWILYQLSHKGGPRILEWVPIPSPADLPDPGIEPGILHCRPILYQLSYEGSPEFTRVLIFGE